MPSQRTLFRSVLVSHGPLWKHGDTFRMLLQMYPDRFSCEAADNRGQLLALETAWLHLQCCGEKSIHLVTTLLQVAGRSAGRRWTGGGLNMWELCVIWFNQSGALKLGFLTYMQLPQSTHTQNTHRGSNNSTKTAIKTLWLQRTWLKRCKATEPSGSMF